MNLSKRDRVDKMASAPVKAGQELVLTVLRAGYRGEGVARHEGFTIFVDGVLPGESAKVKVVEVKPSFARAEALALLAASPVRTVPHCSAYGVCGGCQAQHMDYEAQLEWKRQLVVDALARIGRFDQATAESLVEPVRRMDSPWRYRNKVSLLAARKGTGFVAGFVAEGAHEPSLQTECLIRPVLHDALVNALVDLLTRFGVEAFDESTGRGLVRQVRVRSAKSGDAMVVINTVLPLAEGDAIAQAVAATSLPGGRVVSVVEEVVPLVKDGRQASNAKERVLWGVPELRERVMGLDFFVSAKSFLQVNPVQTEVLYQIALDFASLTGRETVVDLYAGIGTLTLAAAKRAGFAVGVESVPAAVGDARRNSEENGVHNADFYLGQAEDVLPDLVKNGLSADVVLLDPPRAGCKPEVIKAMAAMAAARIVYVSCNPATLARDLTLLQDRGYRLTRIAPVDLFPHTYHVESVALLERAVVPPKGESIDGYD